GYATVNPFANAKIKVGARVRATKKKRPPYTFAEVEKILALLNPAEEERHWAILIGLYTGCRINEAAQLYADDVQEEDGTPFIHFREGRPDQRVKGHKPRKVPISPYLIKAGFLNWVRSKQPTERLISHFTYGR